MNTHLKRIFTLIILLSCAFVAQAQAYRAGYFLKGNSYRHRMNPALTVERGYFSLPMVGNTNINITSNMGLASFLYPKGDGLVTFMHPDVTVDEFLGGISENNYLHFDSDMTVLSLGFYAFGGYNTLDVGFHSRFGINLPKDMFRVMKDMSDHNYSLSNLDLFTKNYADIAIAHSHNITKDLAIGVRLKFIVGLAYAEMLMEKMDVTLDGQQWMINAKGGASMAFMGSKFTFDENGAIDGFSKIEPGLSGMGFGADLGATYDFSNVLTKGLILSASVCDMNFISWKNVSKAGMSPEEPYVFNGFEEIAINDEKGGATVLNQFEQMGNDLGEFFKIKDMGVANKNEFFGATVNVGLEYKMPFYDKLSVGALFTHRFENVYSYTVGSLMLNLSPAKFLDLAAGASVSTFGYDWSAMLNIHCRGFNLFAATDFYAGKVSKEYIPLDNLNASILFGINIPFGKRH